jgi:hypothetical protein
MLEQDDKYKDKYLKYKLKYINLKKIMYGAAAEYYFEYEQSAVALELNEKLPKNKTDLIEQIKTDINKHNNKVISNKDRQYIKYNDSIIIKVIIDNKDKINKSNAFKYFKDYASLIYVKQLHEINEKSRIDLIKTNINKFKNDMIIEIVDNIHTLNLTKGRFIEQIDDSRMPIKSKKFLELFKTLFPLQELIQHNKPTLNDSTYTFNDTLMTKFKELSENIHSINKILFLTYTKEYYDSEMHNIITIDHIMFFLYLKELNQYISELYNGELYYTLMIEGGLDESKDKYRRYYGLYKKKISYHERLISCIMRLLNKAKPVELDKVIKEYLEKTKIEYFKYPHTRDGYNIFNTRNDRCELKL